MLIYSICTPGGNISFHYPSRGEFPRDRGNGQAGRLVSGTNEVDGRSSFIFYECKRADPRRWTTHSRQSRQNKRTQINPTKDRQSIAISPGPTEVNSVSMELQAIIDPREHSTGQRSNPARFKIQDPSAQQRINRATQSSQTSSSEIPNPKPHTKPACKQRAPTDQLPKTKTTDCNEGGRD